MMSARDPAKHMSKRSRLPSLVTIFTTAAVLVTLYFGLKSGLIQKWSARLLAVTQGRGYAELTANRLLNTPECASYRSQVLAYKGQSESDRVTAEISRLYEEGRSAGCQKLDLN